MSKSDTNLYFSKTYSNTVKEVTKKYKLVELMNEKLTLQKLYSFGNKKNTRNELNSHHKPNIKELQTYMGKVSDSIKNLEKEMNDWNNELSHNTFKKILIHRNQSSTQYKQKPKTLNLASIYHFTNTTELLLNKAQTSYKRSPKNLFKKLSSSTNYNISDLNKQMKVISSLKHLKY